MVERIYNAIILNEPYADYVKTGSKDIETRMRMLSKLVGDFIICCDKGKSKGSKNFGKALCIVDVQSGRPMKDEDAERACIENAPGRYAYPLLNRRLFSYDFDFSDYAVIPPGKRNPNWQGVFQVRVPEFVEIIPVNPLTPEAGREK
jgi:hypothetical protein